ncbi:MAG: hypothetical protein IJW17_01170 [Lentisphaeria bacterium]|nr:hypothetical protein [Lentisphaeria bacterium]
MKKLLFLLLAAAVSTGGISAGETARKQMIWAHITPWFQASDHSLYTDWFFNYPLQRAKNDPKSRDITMREDILIAMDKGIDGFFIDIGAEVRAKKEFSWAWTMPAYLKAAEGTPFQVGICLDGPFTAEYLGEYVPKMLKKFGDHPNYPKYNGKYVICTYQFRRLSPKAWAEARQLIKQQGFDIFLIANLAPLPHNKVRIAEFEKYKNVVDCIYFFDAPAHAAEHPSVTNKLLADWCRKNNKLYMSCFHPGYYGAWKHSNDFYNPFRGFDMLYTTVKASMRQKAQWIHLTTWNDLMETAMQERVFTPGVTQTLKYYLHLNKGKKIVEETPEILFAYHREEIPGTLLRLEACNLPSKAGEITISGQLLDWSGKAVATLSPKKVTGKNLCFVEWLFPTEKFAYSPCLIPEITVKSRNFVKKVKMPAVFFVSSWIQNATTLNFSVKKILEDFPNTLAVRQNKNVLNAEISFDSKVEFERIVLFKNDQPIAIFRPEYKKDEILLSVSMIKPHRKTDITVKNGKFLRAVKKTESNNERSVYSWTPEKMVTTWQGEHGITFAGSEDMKINMRYDNGKIFEFSAADLIRKRIISDGFSTWNAKHEMTMMNDEPLRISKGNLSLNLFHRVPRQEDSFFVRYEGCDGSVYMTTPVWPFAKGNPTVVTKILRTAVNMETVTGASGVCFLGKNEFLTPPDAIPIKKNFAVTAKVSLLTGRAGLWKFDGNGADSLGEYPVTHLKAKMFAPEGKEGSCLKFSGKEKIMLPRRCWNLGGFGTLSFDIKPEAVGGTKRQSVIFKSGWYDGFSVNILPEGTLEVIRSHGIGYGEKLAEENFVSTEKLIPGKWNSVKITANAEYMQISVNGKTGKKFKLLPWRNYGNGQVYLGGGRHNTDNYKGLLDNLCIKGF